MRVPLGSPNNVRVQEKGARVEAAVLRLAGLRTLYIHSLASSMVCRKCSGYLHDTA